MSETISKSTRSFEHVKNEINSNEKNANEKKFENDM